MEKKELSKVFHALFSDAPGVEDSEDGKLKGGFATLSANQMSKFKGGFDNNGNCGNCGNCGSGCRPPDNNGNCGNCGTCTELA